MSKTEIKKVEATVMDAKYDIVRGVVMANLYVEGQPRTTLLDESAVMSVLQIPKDHGFDKSQMNNIMKQFAERLKARTAPLYIELSEDQLSGDADGKDVCKIKLQ